MNPPDAKRLGSRTRGQGGKRLKKATKRKIGVIAFAVLATFTCFS